MNPRKPSREQEDAEAVLRAVKDAARLGQLRFTNHGRERMGERSAQARDVKCAAASAVSAEWSDEHASWKITGGKDFDGDSLDIAVTVEGAVVRVITVF